MIKEAAQGKSLLTAIEDEDFGRLHQLLAQSISLNVASPNGWTPLMLAILHGSAGMVQLLLENGADPNLTTQSEENPCRSPLAVAINNGRLEAVKLLIAYNADIDKSHHNGLTAIGLAQKLAIRPLHKDSMANIVSLLKEHKSRSLAVSGC